jgi:antitoxin (DNA-binding transcriptional repressor) of toxin-antitoxin stability system
LSQLLAAVEDGEEVVIARAGRPIAKLVRLGTSPRRGFGDLRGRVWISDDFDAPLPAEVEGAFYD